MQLVLAFPGFLDPTFEQYHQHPVLDLRHLSEALREDSMRRLEILSRCPESHNLVYLLQVRELAALEPLNQNLGTFGNSSLQRSPCINLRGGTVEGEMNQMR